MTVLAEDKVLRINCPGFGTSSILPLGEAKPLAMYEVIVVNPTSILHLFETKSDLVKQIEVLQSDGMTAYRADSDSVIENISTEFELRGAELNAFLKKGGLLVYFLCPPFTVSGPNETMDNYTWLNEWCPDRPTGPNERNMSATIRGKAIEACADAAQAIWVPYLKQSGLEWSTIIRNDNLTDGFVPLALAGPNKCIAGFKSSGPRAGQVVFLPAPYAPECDGKLKECIERWYALHLDDSTASSGLQSLSQGLSSLLSETNESGESGAAEPASKGKSDSNGAKGDLDSAKFFDQKPEPDALIKKMQQNIPEMSVPDWCSSYSFEELDDLRSQLNEVNDSISKAQIRAQELDERIGCMNGLKNALLSAQGEHLTEAVKRVFDKVGWSTKPAANSPDELWLMDSDKTQAIVRLIHTTSTPNRSELAALGESVITYWGDHEIEPKGILVVSTHADKAPQDRPDEDFPESMVDFAKRKNLCLITTLQLLSIFRDLDIGKVELKDIRDNLLTTNGCVGDYRLNKKAKGAATAKR